ncbi:Di-copper centre-containing protein [Basidiobolus meristosporus CBS 931.73]|uniref:Di-copper centre-containing protein n=1 Tax=Basidiobolus meristosporus CBS 931.73 TaxID=1314790 RepID=A0A1Y1YBC0_9FUNG|nr:Di-copper centre-containing protein [Basidiobolus meristosporus CBS 931.73]|eukprot:ORX95341.1 Di-copper centre-containing protein [Basidiobolus meristosporus CBS 931.73]
MRTIPIIFALTLLLTCSNEVVNSQGAQGRQQAKTPASTGKSFTLPKCDLIRARREIRQLSDKERQQFITALQKMKRSGSYERVANIHAQVFELIHNNPMFFPWHRKFLYDFEVAIREVDPEVTIPYWDWSLDSQDPQDSVAFSWFGGNGRKVDRCIDGPFQNWTIVDPTINARRCLKREFSNGDKIEPFVAPELINRDIKLAKTHEDLRALIEVDPHGNVHTGIGGDMSEHWSAQDPFFWMHHAFVDRIWERWQLQHPEVASDYPTTWGGQHGSLRDRFPGLTGNVGQMLDTKKLCYRYSESPSDNISALGDAEEEQVVESEDKNVLQRRSTVDFDWPEGLEGKIDNGQTTLEPSAIVQPEVTNDQVSSQINSAPQADPASESSSKVQDLFTSHGLEGEPNEHVYTEPTRKVAAEDKTSPSKYKLRRPGPLTEKWIKMMGFDRSKVRKAEARHASAIEQLNQNEGYVSPICPAKWKKTIDEAAQFTRKYVRDNYFKIPIEEVKNYSKTTFDVEHDGGNRFFNAKSFFTPGFFSSKGFGFNPAKYLPHGQKVNYHY